MPNVDPCRTVTAEEIAHYLEFGWAKLKAFVEPGLVRLLLDLARDRMGEDGDSNAPSALQQPFFNPEFGAGLQQERMSALIHAVGRSAKAMMRPRPGLAVRYFGDLFLPKLPAARPARHAGGGETYYHQDYITWSLDRSDGMTFWIALEDLDPRSGTMAFLSGSHRQGVFGDYKTQGRMDVLQTYPELMDDCVLSEPVAYTAGDATVHSSLCVHGASANLTQRPRWAYAIIVNPADACWTGAPAEAYESAGLRLNAKLDDGRFPVLDA